MCGQTVALGVGQVFGHRPAQRAVVADQHVGQPLLATLLGPLLPAVQCATRLRGTTRHHHRTHVRCLEYPESGVGEELCAFDQLQPETQVGSIGTEPSHRIGVADARHRQRKVVADQGPHRLEHLFGNRDDVVGLDEAQLHVQLGEFRLTVGAEILVAIAAGDLVVALHAGHHQQLLEQLRTLRQRVEGTGLQPGRHQEVARPLRSRARHRRRLDLDEVVRGQYIARRRIYLGAQTNCVSGAVTAQVEVAIAQPDLLACGLVELERERCTLPQHSQRRRVDFDLAGGDLRVGVTFRTDLDDTLDCHAELGAQAMGLSQHVVGAKHHLGNPCGVAQVDEDHPAVVAPTRDPPGQRHLLTGVGGPQ